MTRFSLRQPLSFDTATTADFVAATPALVVRGTVDVICAPDSARRVHDRIAGSRLVVWLETTEQIDLDDEATVVDADIQHVAGFFDSQLVGSR